MGIDINTNIASLNAQMNLYASQNSLRTSVERLSTGLRINSAADDPAGLAIATGMTSQINGLNQATINANAGLSFLQTASGAMTGISASLERIRGLALEAANGTNSTSDLESINTEVQQLKSEIQQVATNTSYNGIALLDGSVNGLAFQVGANRNDAIVVESIQNMQLSALGTSGAGSSTTGTATVAALNAGDLTLDGVAVGASAAGADAGQAASSAWAIAAAINAVSGNSGVTATAQTTLTGSAPASNAAIQDFSINGVDIGPVAAGVANLAAAINQAAPNTGVTALANAANGLSLTAADGRNIEIELNGTAINSGVAAADRAAFLAATGLPGQAVGTQASAAVAAVPAVPGTPAQYGSQGQIIVPAQPGIPGIPGQPAVSAAYALTTGTVTIKSQDTNGILVAGASAASAGFTDGLNNQLSVTTVPGIANLNVLSQGTAQNAITSMDSAILMVDNSQAQLGAYENRFASVIANIQSEVENLSSSRSAVEDTDFAAETGNLARARILQQAGTAMLAQANSSPDMVRALLR